MKKQNLFLGLGIVLLASACGSNPPGVGGPAPKSYGRIVGTWVSDCTPDTEISYSTSTDASGNIVLGSTIETPIGKIDFMTFSADGKATSGSQTFESTECKGSPKNTFQDSDAANYTVDRPEETNATLKVSYSSAAAGQTSSMMDLTANVYFKTYNDVVFTITGARSMQDGKLVEMSQSEIEKAAGGRPLTLTYHRK